MDITFGIDISSSQKQVDFTAVRAAGVGFCVCKASEGASHNQAREAYYGKSIQGAKKNGMLCGAYLFAHAGRDAQTQAAVFRQVVEVAGVALDLPPALDIEEQGRDGRERDQVTRVCAQILTTLARDFHRKPLLYTSAGFADQYLDLSALPPYLLWIASWEPDYAPPVGTIPTWEPGLPDGVDAYTLWQYSQAGRCAGIAGPVDLDLFWGNREMLETLGMALSWPGYIMEVKGEYNQAEDVRLVQARLQVETTGEYGMTTGCRVMRFQEENGIGRTVKVGQETWDALFNR